MTSSSITVQWGPVDCIHRNGDITGYSVQYVSENVSVSGDSSGGMYVISGLMPSTTYSIQVAANNSAGTGPYSRTILNQTAGIICMVLLFYLYLFLIPLSTVVAPVLSVIVKSATSISLSWTSADSEDVSYEVMWETDDIGGCSGITDMNSTILTDGSTSYDIMGLEEDSSYSITLTVSSPKAAETCDSVVKTLEAGKF